MEGSVEFTAYCIEEYKSSEKLSGREVIELFSNYGVLDYVSGHYDALHTTGPQYIVHDIKKFIDARRGNCQ